VDESSRDDSRTGSNSNTNEAGPQRRAKRRRVSRRYRSSRDVPFMIREFKPEDTNSIVRLFHDTVHKISVRDYSHEQINAWAPEQADLEQWLKRLRGGITIVAEENQTIISFARLEPNGHIDCFYTHSDHQNEGYGSELLSAIEQRAKALGLKKVFTESSITAKTFFLKKGFSLLRQQTATVRGVKMVNFIMEKEI
jgi:GNAT superfamily N-acetyltransferase